nr:hypothetical protein BgiMline_003929 [Biomphalaria glabrata]
MFIPARSLRCSYQPGLSDAHTSQVSQMFIPARSLRCSYQPGLSDVHTSQVSQMFIPARSLRCLYQPDLDILFRCLMTEYMKDVYNVHLDCFSILLASPRKDKYWQVIHSYGPCVHL